MSSSDRFRTLLRSERRAVDVYARLVGRLPGAAVRDLLRRLLGGHRLALDSLRARRADPASVLRTSGLPPNGALHRSHASGATEASEPRHLDLGRVTGILRRVEDSCLEGYSAALRDTDLSADDRVLLLSHLLPRQRSHDALLAWIDELAATT